MYRPVLVTAPASKPLSVAEIKSHLRIEDADDNTYVETLLDAAIAYLDGWSGVLGRCLITQTWRQDYDGFSYVMRLPLFPVASITSVKYDDADDVSPLEQTVSSSNYNLQHDDEGAYVRFIDTFSFPNVSDDPPSVRITYAAGSANAAAVPADIKHAMLLLIGAWYANRENAVVGVSAQNLPSSVAADALLSKYRRVRF